MHEAAWVNYKEARQNRRGLEYGFLILVPFEPATQ